jgi:hypothetical protein
MELISLLATSTVIRFDTQLLNFIGGTVVPLLVAVFTKRLASGRLKSAVMLVFSVLASAITVALGEPEGGWPLYDYLFSLFQIVVTGGVVYTNVFSKVGVIDFIQRWTGSFGLGTNARSE